MWLVDAFIFISPGNVRSADKLITLLMYVCLVFVT